MKPPIPVYLTLERANAIVAGALSTGERLSLKPLSVAILDAGGHLVAFQRSDGCSLMRPQIAIAKAAGTLALGISSRRIGEMATERPGFISALTSMSPGGMVPAAGGLVVINDDGVVVGAIGVTGDTSDNDEICARAGVESAGLRTLE